MVVNGAFLERLVLAALRLGGDAATEHVELRTIFEVGEPYMTVYDANQIQCSCHRILHGLYSARGLPRTAQAWQCCGPGGVTVDMINVHAPSGDRS